MSKDLIAEPAFSSLQFLSRAQVNLVGLRDSERSIEPLIQLDRDVLTNLIGDPLRLGQILINLSNNAAKFTEKGEVKISFSVAERQSDDIKLNFVITYSGIGMT